MVCWGWVPPRTPPVSSLSATSLVRFLCGTVNDFVAEVGRAYKRATENKQEAELMARKVGLGRLRWVVGGCWGCACHGSAQFLGCPGKYGILRHLGSPEYQEAGCSRSWGPGQLDCPGKPKYTGFPVKHMMPRVFKAAQVLRVPREAWGAQIFRISWHLGCTGSHEMPRHLGYLSKHVASRHLGYSGKHGMLKQLGTQANIGCPEQRGMHRHLGCHALGCQALS